MQCPCFSDNQSKKLTLDVLAFHNKRSDEALHTSIHLSTQRLLYSLPSYLRILPEEDCCEFLFYCYDTIDHYIDSYREGNLSYLGYIVQVVRKRSRYFMTLRHAKKAKEQVMIDFEQAQQIEDESMCVAETAEYLCQYNRPLFTQINLVSEDSMPLLFQTLVDNPMGSEYPSITLTPAQRALKEKLKSKVNRKRFIIMLAISPHLMNQHLLIEIACMLGVDLKLLDEYLSTAEKTLDAKKKTKELLELTSRRHFRRLMEIQASLQATTDQQEREKLKGLQVWTEKAFAAKIQKIRELEFHLSHSQIGTLLDIPKGTVASSVHYIKILLQECLDES